MECEILNIIRIMLNYADEIKNIVKSLG